ncbi:hypothetical protein [Bradyrhizobium sp. HKCCYLS20291]|uniref:hypothetical protein n=1 Tax=Bradyrhizobium sp. HKCCYLS20291 TaxID=3420766 RepID=UPI003EB9F325
MPPRTLIWLLFGLSILLYAACLPCESFCVDGRCSGWPSWSVLVFGFWPLSLANLTWTANPILIVAWTFGLAKIDAILTAVLSASALMIGASFLLANSVITNEAGIPNSITGYGTGYWLWLASMMTTCIWAFAQLPFKSLQRDRGS